MPASPPPKAAPTVPKKRVKSGRTKNGSVDHSLPKDPFKDPNYENVSHPKAAKEGHYKYLDGNGNPVPDKSDASHLYPPD